MMKSSNIFQGQKQPKKGDARSQSPQPTHDLRRRHLNHELVPAEENLNRIDLSTDYEPIPADEQEQAEILHQTYSEQSAAATGLYVKASADFTAQLVYTDSDGSSQSKSIHVQISEDAAPTQIRRYQQELDDAKAEYAELQNARLNEAAEIRKLRTYYDDFKGWAEEFDTAPLEMKRMILSHLIDRVEVGRKYQVIVKFNMKYRQFLECTAETYNTEIGA